MIKYLSFCHREPDNHIIDLESETIDSLTSLSGVYIIRSKRKYFPYPFGTSPIIYIGLASNLRRRLKEHRSDIENLRKSPKKDRGDLPYYSRFQYFITFGSKVHYFTTRGKQHEKNLENKIMMAFYKRYGALPIGNGAFSWEKV